LKLNVINQAGVNDVIYRVLKLQPQSTRKWGTMAVTEMLHHCSTANQLILNYSIQNKKSTFKQKLIRVVVLHFLPAFPKNIKAPKQVVQMQSKISTKSFEEEKNYFIETINQFPEHQFPEKMYHPSLGNLSPKQWGVATWMHMDHHLRQFGV
jgi:hypothetical protein